jgi:CelD/BcsL family acetyltransferase involved in cellulose biosynthesis
VGADAPTLAREFAETLLADPTEPKIAIVTGLARSAPLWTALVAALQQRCALGVGRPQRRWRASLQGGIDGYLGRRARTLRRELRREERRARDHGVRFERGAGSADELFERVLDIERRSWKFDASTGLNATEMRAFYGVLVPRLHARGRLRAVFARIDDTDIGFIVGGVAGTLYRGLQFSFDDRYRQLGVGNLLQLAELRALCDEGFDTYDLGIDIGYKARWADERVETSTLVIRG